MRRSGKKKKDQTDDFLKKAKIGGKLPGRNISEKSDIDQIRIENRREAGLEDKTPAGDAGVEDNPEESISLPKMKTFINRTSLNKG